MNGHRAASGAQIERNPRQSTPIGASPQPDPARSGCALERKRRLLTHNRGPASPRRPPVRVAIRMFGFFRGQRTALRDSGSRTGETSQRSRSSTETCSAPTASSSSALSPAGSAAAGILQVLESHGAGAGPAHVEAEDALNERRQLGLALVGEGDVFLAPAPPFHRCRPPLVHARAAPYRRARPRTRRPMARPSPLCTGNRRSEVRILSGPLRKAWKTGTSLPG
jgi:hypothetical protein